MDYSWLLALVSAGFGALVTGIVLRRLDISRMSYREARQMLSAIVGSLSRRIEQDEALTKEVSEQLQILSATQARLNAGGQMVDKEHLPRFIQDWLENLKRVIQKVDGLQNNLERVEQEIQDFHIRVDQLSVSREHSVRARVGPLGVVTEDTLRKLTPTERSVLELLVAGPKAGPEIGRLVAKSREHTARLMKSLFEQGFVEREANRQPYEYRLNEKLRDALAHPIEQKTTQVEF